MNTLAALFPDENFRFHLGLQRGEPAEFFAARDTTGRVLAERRRWLATDELRYARLLPGGEALLGETLELAKIWGAAIPAGSESLVGLGGGLEPDMLLMAPDGQGEHRLCGGVLCFPTSWALEEKLGQPMSFIHGPVPGLNQAMGPQIGQFLARLKPGTAYFRHNWGLAAVDELNLHPALRRPRPALPLDPARLWLRVEHQALLALPSGSGLVFGIRIELMPVETVRAHATAAAGLKRALETMPAAMADYKGIGDVRLPLANWLTA